MTRAAVLAAAIALILGAAIRHAAQRPCPEPYVEDEDGVQPADPYIATRWFPDGSWRYEPVSVKWGGTRK